MFPKSDVTVIRSALNKITSSNYAALSNAIFIVLENPSSPTSFLDLLLLASKANDSQHKTFARLLKEAIESYEDIAVELGRKIEKFLRESPSFSAELCNQGVLPQTQLEEVIRNNVSSGLSLDSCCEFIHLCKHSLSPQFLDEMVPRLSQEKGISHKSRFQLVTESFRTPCETAEPFLQTTEKSRTIYLSHIDCNVSEGDFMRMLLSCGDVQKVRLCGNPKQSTQYAFVEFSTVSGAENLLGLEGKRLGKYNLHCSLSRSKIHDFDPRDAVVCKNGRAKACTFGIDARLQWCSNPLSVSSSQFIEKCKAPDFVTNNCEISKHFIEAEDPSDLLLNVIVGNSKTKRDQERAAKIIQHLCDNCGLLTTWVQRAFEKAVLVSDPKDSCCLHELRALLVKTRVLPKC